jgi:hypothetical protein
MGRWEMGNGKWKMGNEERKKGRKINVSSEPLALANE